MNNKKEKFISRFVRINIDLSKYDERFKKAQEHLDMSIVYDTEPYVRYDTGLLNENAKTQNDFGSGKIIYSAYNKYGHSYAIYPYYTFNTVNTSVHPEATQYWFDFSKSDNKEKWIKEVKEIVGGKK